MRALSSTVAIFIIFVTIFIIPFVSGQSINYIEVNGTFFTIPEVINITGWTSNSSSDIYLWNNHTGELRLMASGIGIQTIIINSSDQKPGNYSVFFNSTSNSTLEWKTFSILSITTTATTIEITASSTILTTTLPTEVEDKEPPIWSNLRHDPPIVKESTSVNILVDWSDNINLDSVIIYENSTGVWKEHICNKATGLCSLGIITLSAISVHLPSSILIIGIIIPFIVIILILVNLGRIQKIALPFLGIVIFVLLLSIILSPEISRNISKSLAKLGIIPVVYMKTFSHIITASKLHADEVVAYYSFANDTTGNSNTTEIKNFIVQAIEITPKEIETVSVKEEHEKAEINKPVKWRKELVISNPSSEEVKGYEVTGFPKDAKNIIVKDENGKILFNDKNSWKTDIAGKEEVSYFIEYETPPPYKEEFIIKPLILGKNYEKRINVKSDFAGHYKNVKAYTDIPEELFQENYKIKLYHIQNGSKINVIDNPNYEVKFTDSDNDGYNDRIEWIVPQLSEEIFEVEASITIITVQSYPTVYGNWTVRFNTTGTANLTITPINNTNFDIDIQFLELKCGNNEVNSVYDGKSVFYTNWSCSEEGRIINRVLKEGKHILEFKFGDDVKYAYNQAGLEYYINTSETEQSTGASWREALTLTWNDPSDSRWLVLASWESRHSATGANGNYQVSKDGIEQALYVERVLQANNEYISYFFPQVHEGDGGTVKYSISFQAVSGTAYVRRVRLVAIRLDNLLNANYNYTFNATQITNIDSTWGGPEDANVTISPSTTGWYLILASLAKNSGSTSRSVLARVVVDSEFIPSSTGNYGTIQDTATTEFHPFQVIAARQLNAGPHTISLQAISSSQSFADIRDRSVVILRLSDVFTFFGVSDTGETSTTSTTFQNKSTLTIPSGNDGKYLILSMLTLRGSSTSYPYESRTFSDDYSEIGKFQDFRPQTTTDYITSGMIYNGTFNSNQHIIKNQFRRVSILGGTAYAKNSEIVAIKLNASAVSLSFNITLPGLTPIEASGTQPGTLTTSIEFNTSNPTESNVQPCVVGYGCVSGYKQDASAPIFTFKNTGNVAEQWNISLSQSLTSYGITLYGNTSSNPTLKEINTSGWIVNNTIPVGSSVQVWLYANFVNSPPGTFGNIYINHTSLQA
jgi:hypothetical protein